MYADKQGAYVGYFYDPTTLTASAYIKKGWGLSEINLYNFVNYGGKKYTITSFLGYEDAADAKKLQKITFPSSVTSIGKNGTDFALTTDGLQGTSVSELVISDSVVKLSEESLDGIDTLNNLSIPAYLTNRDPRSNSLKNVVITYSSDSSKDVDKFDTVGKMFSGNRSIVSVNVDKDIKKIDADAFKGCTSLISITFY